MNKNTLIYLLLLLAAISCVTEKDEIKLEGHWHQTNGDTFFKTLDIEDTIVITDRYLLDGGQRIEYPRTNKQGEPILPLDFYKYSGKFAFRNDTLTIWDGTSVHKYVRNNLKDCLISDRYANSNVDISLEEANTAEKYEISFKTYCSENLFIGRLRKERPYYDSLGKLYPDSVFIQARDSWITLSDIPLFCKNMKDICMEYKPSNINFHADSSVPAEFLKQIQGSIPDTIAIHRVVKIVNGDIGLQKIR